ncbi:MAG TPA: four helix bundle protein [Anaerolineae bacterium]|nr:four helix bundle protein [Anaerolineae bacterium]
MPKGDDIEDRLIDFAVRIIKVSRATSRVPSGAHIANQILRSGTAPAAYYAEARGAESKNDFIHKLKICLKELNETRVWLKIIVRSEMLSENRIQGILQESDELCRIINASVKTAKTKK